MFCLIDSKIILLKNNVDKCHVLVSTTKPIGIKIGDCTIDNSAFEKLLGLKIDVNLNINDHITTILGETFVDFFTI